MKSILTKKQTTKLSKTIPLKSYGYKEQGQIVVEIRYDDRCGNGHNSFAITGEVRRLRNMTDAIISCGCIHEDIKKHFPKLTKYIKWHHMSSDGPMHYVANTVYHASNRDCYDLLEGEHHQIVNGKTGLPCWVLKGADVPKYIDSDGQPEAPEAAKYVPFERIGEGKAREFDRARSTAIWPEATDEDLSQSKEDLNKALEARLPALIKNFIIAVTELGFIF